MRSDTTIVAHISADRSRVELVSIPRDLVIDRPACTMKDGTTTRAKAHDMFNNAFAVGWDHSQDLGTAAACTWKTVETITGVRLDGFVLLDFVGLTAMVDAIGGVPICLPKALDDPVTGLHVPAGPQVFDGPTAVQFARARHNIGDSSDTQRILRQHDLMAAMARSVLSAKTLSNPVALYSFARRSHEVADRERRVRVARGPHRARALAAARGRRPDRVPVDADGGLADEQGPVGLGTRGRHALGPDRRRPAGGRARRPSTPPRHRRRPAARRRRPPRRPGHPRAASVTTAEGTSTCT